MDDISGFRAVVMEGAGEFGASKVKMLESGEVGIE